MMGVASIARELLSCSGQAPLLSARRGPSPISSAPLRPQPRPAAPLARSVPGPRPPAALAPREARGAADRVLEDVGPGAGLQGEGVGERHAEPVDRGAAVGEHRALREAREVLRELECPLEVPAGGDELVDEAD